VRYRKLDTENFWEQWQLEAEFDHAADFIYKEQE
jgi:hypothetical protein